MIKVVLTNEILKYITEIDKNRYKVSSVKLPRSVSSRLRKNSKKKSSYASNKIEGNPLSEKQVDEVIERDERKHFLKPEQEVRNYFLALNYLEEKVKEKERFSKKLILDVQKYVEKGASKEKIGLRGAMPPGVLFAVYDSQTGNPDYIPPEYLDIPELLDESYIISWLRYIRLKTEMVELHVCFPDIFWISMDMDLMASVHWKNTLHMTLMSIMNRYRWVCRCFITPEETIRLIRKYGLIIF